jgi:hypothetical protein
LPPDRLRHGEEPGKSHKPETEGGREGSSYIMTASLRRRVVRSLRRGRSIRSS